jgi:hypothetical protein
MAVEGEPPPSSSSPAPKDVANVDAVLPPLPTPDTKTPVQLNQQVNVYQQIPPSAWDKLSANQIVDLTQHITNVMDGIDKRHFDYAMYTADKHNTRSTLSILFGGVIACIGISGTIYLAMNGHDLIAISIMGPLATILAILVGARLMR